MLKTSTIRRIGPAATVLAALLLVAACAILVSPRAADAQLTIDIAGPGEVKANLYLAPPLPLEQGKPLSNLANDMTRKLERNFALLPFISQIPGNEILGGPRVQGVTSQQIDFKRFRTSRADLLLTQGWRTQPGGQGEVELRVFETYSGSRLIGKSYSDVTSDLVDEVADNFCALLLETLTGDGSFFQSRLAFVRKAGKDKHIWRVKPNGEQLQRLTDLPDKSLSPAWSFDGSRLVFSHVGKLRGHRLGIWEHDTGKAKLYNLPGSTVISPVFAPNGNIAVTLDTSGVPDVYLLGDELQPTSTLAESWSIDVSPSFDKSGRKMAFASGRVGNPHIFMLDRNSGQVTRITFEGKYNTNPALSPDGRLLAFSRQTPGGHRIFVKDLGGGVERQVSFGPGSDESPAWSPDGYFLAFASNRGGEYKLYITTRNGDGPMLVETGPGEATSPAWQVIP